MANSQSFDGLRVSVKIPWQAVAHLDQAAAGNSRETVMREWLESWRTLAGLAPFLYQRLVYSAQKRRLPLAAIVNEALTQYCSRLPEPPPRAAVATPIDLVDIGKAKSGKRPARR